MGRRNTFALPPQTTNYGPLTRGPFTCQPPHLPRGATRASAWTRVALATRPRHIRATKTPAWARVALPRGLACHVASMQVPRHVSQWFLRKNPLFCILKINKIIEINSGKIQKNLRNSKIDNFKNRTPFKLKFSSLDHKFIPF